MPTRNVNLTPELDSLITSRIEFGLYADASEVVCAALRLLKQEEHEFEEKMAVLRAAIQEGLDSGIAEDGVFERLFAYIHEVAAKKSENVA
jgi:antitoxin ParD1/3/4